MIGFGAGLPALLGGGGFLASEAVLWGIACSRDRLSVNDEMQYTGPAVVTGYLSMLKCSTRCHAKVRT